METFSCKLYKLFHIPPARKTEESAAIYFSKVDSDILRYGAL
jgi:hypothetical protein